MRFRKSLSVSIPLGLLLLLTPLIVFAQAPTDTSIDTATTVDNTTSIETPQNEKGTLRRQKEEALKRNQAAKETTSGADDGIDLGKRIRLQEQYRVAKEKYKAKREEFKEKIKTIKDEKKKAAVERIDAKIANINQRRTDHMGQIIEKLNDILIRISQHAETLKTEGKNTGTLDIAITQAQAALVSAQTAVTNQAGKEYIATITNEENLRNTIGKTISQMQTDYRITYKTIIDAKQAAHTAAKELKKARGGVNNEDIVTSTPTTESTQ